VPRQERHRRALHVPDGDTGRRWAVRRRDVELLGVVEELVEAAAPDDGDAGTRNRHAAECLTVFPRGADGYMLDA
jgi:hypothetical protein